MKYGVVVAACVALWVAAAQPARAYTINETEKGQVIRWTTTEVHTRVDASFSDMLVGGAAQAGLVIALDAWRGYEGVPAILMVEGEAATPGYHRGQDSNTVHYLADWPYEAEKLAVTVVTYEMNTGRLLDADILINGGAPFRLLSEREPRVADAYDLAAVLTHEVGHMLGLGESEADPEATMWPYAHPGDTHQRTLAQDDEVAVVEAYSRAVPDGPTVVGCSGASVGGSMVRNGVGLMGVVAPIVAMTAWMRRRQRTRGRAR